MTDYVTPVEQAVNLIRYIGDKVKESSEFIHLQPTEICSIIGAQNSSFASRLIIELQKKGLIDISHHLPINGEHVFKKVTLSLDGWERYEAERRGQFAGNYGFLAMQFDDPIHETFAKEVLKPAVKEGIGYDLHDQRDKSKAGIIDNHLRVNIRDALVCIC